MPIQTFEITADVPEGYEPTGEYRPPRYGEPFSDHGILSTKAKLNHGPACGSYPILRPSWQWPEWIKPGCWIAMDEDGSWCAFNYEPQLSVDPHLKEWHEGDCDGAASYLTNGTLTFSPPPCTDWRQSKRQKPI